METTLVFFEIKHSTYSSKVLLYDIQDEIHLYLKQSFFSLIYLSLNNGRLIVIDILNGKPSKIVKIDNEKISRPYVLNNNMYIVRDNAILKLN